MHSLPPLRVALCGLGLPLALASCAISNKDHRRILNYLDTNLTPSSTAGKWCLSPVALPVGLAAGVVDGAIVHPATQFDDAWWDTRDMLWSWEAETPFRRVVYAPLALVATPVVYSLDWVARALFDLGDRDVGDEGDAGAEFVPGVTERPLLVIDRGGVR